MRTDPTNSNQDKPQLTHEQRRYLQTIFDHFHEKAEWPERRYLERTLIKEDLDAREIGLRLAGRVGDPPQVYSWDSDHEAVLTVPDMTLCRGSELHLGDAYRPLDIGGHLSRLDTSDFASLTLDPLFAALRTARTRVTHGR